MREIWGCHRCGEVFTGPAKCACDRATDAAKAEAKPVTIVVNYGTGAAVPDPRMPNRECALVPTFRDLKRAGFRPATAEDVRAVAKPLPSPTGTPAPMPGLQTSCAQCGHHEVLESGEACIKCGRNAVVEPATVTGEILRAMRAQGFPTTLPPSVIHAEHPVHRFGRAACGCVGGSVVRREYHDENPPNCRACEDAIRALSPMPVPKHRMYRVTNEQTWEEP
mgnify:FL=1